jgi:hypothetical protein
LESIYGIISNDSYEYEERRLHLMGKGEEKKEKKVE